MLADWSKYSPFLFFLQSSSRLCNLRAQIFLPDTFTETEVETRLHVDISCRFMCENSWRTSSCSSVWPLTSWSDPAVTAVWYERVEYRLNTNTGFACYSAEGERGACIILLTVSELHYSHSSHTGSENPPQCTAAAFCRSHLQGPSCSERCPNSY